MRPTYITPLNSAWWKKSQNRLLMLAVVTSLAATVFGALFALSFFAPIPLTPLLAAFSTSLASSGLSFAWAIVIIVATTALGLSGTLLSFGLLGDHKTSDAEKQPVAGVSTGEDVPETTSLLGSGTGQAVPSGAPVTADSAGVASTPTTRGGNGGAALAASGAATFYREVLSAFTPTFPFAGNTGPGPVPPVRGVTAGLPSEDSGAGAGNPKFRADLRHLVAHGGFAEVSDTREADGASPTSPTSRTGSAGSH